MAENKDKSSETAGPTRHQEQTSAFCPRTPRSKCSGTLEILLVLYHLPKDSTLKFVFSAKSEKTLPNLNKFTQKISLLAASSCVHFLASFFDQAGLRKHLDEPSCHFWNPPRACESSALPRTRGQTTQQNSAIHGSETEDISFSCVRNNQALMSHERRTKRTQEERKRDKSFCFVLFTTPQQRSRTLSTTRNSLILTMNHAGNGLSRTAGDYLLRNLRFCCDGSDSNQLFTIIVQQALEYTRHTAHTKPTVPNGTRLCDQPSLRILHPPSQRACSSLPCDILNRNALSLFVPISGLPFSLSKHSLKPILFESLSRRRLRARLSSGHTPKCLLRQTTSYDRSSDRTREAERGC